MRARKLDRELREWRESHARSRHYRSRALALPGGESHDGSFEVDRSPLGRPDPVRAKEQLLQSVLLQWKHSPELAYNASLVAKEKGLVPHDFDPTTSVVELAEAIVVNMLEESERRG